jgi:hypothetical protein
MATISSLWSEGDPEKPVPIRPSKNIFRLDILDAIEKKLEEMSDELRELSLDIHSTWWLQVEVQFRD